MNFLSRVLIALLCFSSIGYAADEPLKIGVSHFEPPFVLQGSNNEISGFDVEMMNSICKIMKRPCEFRLMKFNELIPALTSETIDIAIGAIVITPQRAEVVNFSLPYAVSYSRFLTNRSTQSTQPFSLQLLNNQKIGVETGTVFGSEVERMGVQNPRIIEFPRIEEVIEGLKAESVKFILVDNPTAVYWEANSSGAFVTIGEPFSYGFGYGIAISRAKPDLLAPINKALLQFQNLPDYRLYYDKYFGSFK